MADSSRRGRHGLLPLLVGLVLLSVPPAAAAAEARESCLVLSFAPLDITIPACDRLIASGTLDDEGLFEARMARAEAYRWAITYHWGHEVEPSDLLDAQLADLDSAVALAQHMASAQDFASELRRALAERGAAQLQRGANERAVADFSAAIELGEPPRVADLYGRAHALERLGRFDAAIEDINEILAMIERDDERADWLVDRARLFESAGDGAAALADYRQAVTLVPDHREAAAALDRLGARP